MNTLLKQNNSRSSSFIAEVAHELRSPLGGLEALADLLLQTNLTPEQSRLVTGLQAASAHLRAVADTVISANGPVKLDFDVREESFDLASLVDAVGIAAEARARVKGLAFHLNMPGG
jgi:signal transduction histidine kinase